MPLTFTHTFSVVDQREQCAECRLIEAERGIDAAHMVDHDRHRRTLECGREVGDQGRLHVDLQMPADIGKALAEMR